MPYTFNIHSSSTKAALNWHGIKTTGCEIVLRDGDFHAVYWRLAGVWHMACDPMTSAEYAAWDRTASRPTAAFESMQDWLNRQFQARHA